MNKDLIILNLLLGWEVIYLSKKGRKVSIRLREYPGKDSRFIRVTFSKCPLSVILDFRDGQLEDFALFDFKGCIFSRTIIEEDEVISVHLVKGYELIGAIKIIASDVAFEFTSK